MSLLKPWYVSIFSSFTPQPKTSAKQKLVTLVALCFLGLSAGATAQRTARPLAATPKVESPVFSLAGGTYSSAQTVTITDATPGATIYYSTNGSYVGACCSAVYSGPITVSTSQVVVAMAVSSGYADSDTVSAAYLISDSPTSFVYTVAGSSAFQYRGDGGLASAASFYSPVAAAADSAGNIFVADSAYNSIRKIDGKTGIITTIAGNGTASHTGDGGPAKNATLWFPQDLAIDSAGNLYILEWGDYVVRVISASTGNISTYAGSQGGGSGPLGGPAVGFNLTGMNAISVDPAGNLLISTGFQALRVDANTGNISSLGTYYSGYMQGIASDGLNTYVSDTNGGVVRRFDSHGNVTVYAGGGNGSITNGGPANNVRLQSPRGLAVDGAGNLYIADIGLAVICKVRPGLGFISVYAGIPGVGASAGGDGDPALSVSIDPEQISFDASGNLLMTESSLGKVAIITLPGPIPATQTPAPTFSVAAGTYANPQTLTLSDSVPMAGIHLSFDGIDSNTAGQTYHGSIQLTGAATIKAVAVAPGYLRSAVVSATYHVTQPPFAVISTVAGTGRYGYTASGGVATNLSIGAPHTTISDKAGNLYIADYSNHLVWKLDSSTGNLVPVAGTGGSGFSGDGGQATAAKLTYPAGLALDASGNLYIADISNYRVRKIDAQTGIISTFAGGGNNTTGHGDGGPAISAFLSSPEALAFDSAGNLYIGELFAIRKVNAGTGIISTVAGGSTNGPSGDGLPATSANIRPPSIAFDQFDNLYLVDLGRSRICRVDAKTGILKTIAGKSTSIMDTDGTLATEASIDPSAVAVDPKGTVYFADFNSIVRKIDPLTGQLVTVAGNTYRGFSGDGGAATMATLNAPRGLAFDSVGNLYIADAGSDTVRKVIFPALAAAPNFNPPAGTYNGRQTVSMSTSTANAKIYFTTDGSTPDTGSTEYTAPLTIAQSETVKAIATAPGYAESTIASAAYVINYLTPTVTLTSSANSAFLSNPVTLTAAVSSTGGTPSGTVTFLEGTTSLGSATLAGGVATFTTSTLTAGSHTITASYAGDNVFVPVTSTAVTVTVEDFQIGAASGNSTSATVSKGGTATYTLAVTPPSGLTTPVDVTFSVTGLPSGAIATFEPATVPKNSGATSVKLSILVPASAAVHAENTSGSRRLPFLLAFVLVPLMGVRRVRRAIGSNLLLPVLLFIAIAGGMALTGCGGGGGGSSSGNPPPTQPQTYNLIVTATAGALTHTTNLTLTVQ